MSDVTRILEAVQQGEAGATEELLPIVYNELRQMAAAKLSREAPGQTLQATALVHEVFLRLVGDNPTFSGSADSDHTRMDALADVATNGVQWECQAHFFAAAAEAMRRILIDSARRKRQLKRGGDRNRINWEFVDLSINAPPVDLIALDEALTKLEEEFPVKASVVKLRYFGGMTIQQTAAALGISEATVKRYWFYARAWLRGEISEGNEGTD